MPLRLILKHVYIDCAFKINFEGGWRRKPQHAVSPSPFLKAFRNNSVLSTNIQVGRAPPACHCCSFSFKDRLFYIVNALTSTVFYSFWPSCSLKSSVVKYKRGKHF